MALDRLSGRVAQMGIKKQDRVLQVAQVILAKFPPPYPVRIKVCQMPRQRELGVPRRTFGDVTLEDRRFTVRLEIRWPLSVIIDTLIHELAHIRSWPFAKLWRDRPAHSSEFGIAYAAIYRFVVDGEGIDDGRG